MVIYENMLPQIQSNMKSEIASFWENGIRMSNKQSVHFLKITYNWIKIKEINSYFLSTSFF